MLRFHLCCFIRRNTNHSKFCLHLENIGHTIAYSRMPQSINSAPLLYSSLTTRSSHYPKWIMLHSSPLPVALKRLDLGNDICRALLSSGHAVVVPPSANSLVDVLGWIQDGAPFPIPTCYHIFVKEIYAICMPHSHIHPFDCHVTIFLKAMSSFIVRGDDETCNMVMQALKDYIMPKYGRSIAFILFDEVILESYTFLRQVSTMLLLLLLLFVSFTNISFTFYLLFYFFLFFILFHAF